MKTNHNKTTETEIVLVDGEGTMTTIHRQLPAIACRFSAKTDMREVYLSLGSFPWNKGLTCPVVLADQQILEGLDYQFVLSLEETACLVLTREGLSSQEIVRIATGRTQGFNGAFLTLPGEQFGMFYTEKDMAPYYAFAGMIAENLDIRCPQIIVRDIHEGYLRRAYPDKEQNGKISMIEVMDSPDCDLFKEFHVLAHEMRHAWQQECAKEEYSANYKMPDEFKGSTIVRYFLQIAELDAEAYALHLMSALSGEPWKADTAYPMADHAIDSYAEALPDEPFSWVNEQEKKDLLLVLAFAYCNRYGLLVEY